MGVDFYACDNCGDTFPDCGDYFRCDCEAKFCCTECGGYKSVEPEEDVDDHEVITCIHCRMESATSDDLLHFLLKKFDLTHDQAMEMYRKEL